jgi:hypothetical protein
VHSLGLTVAMKNDVEQVKDLIAHFDFVIDEQCFQYKECDTLLPFISAGKALFEVEYKLQPRRFCPAANAMNFNCHTHCVPVGVLRENCKSAINSTL